MTNDGWGSKWSSGAGWFEKPKPKDDVAPNSDATPEAAGVVNWSTQPSHITWNKASKPSKTIIWPKDSELKAQGSNLVDDQAYLYFQCEGCTEILDPHTKSFKTLQDKRAEAGWQVKWNLNGQGYKVYCTECGEKV